MITLGIDLGTSSVKALLLDDDRIVASASAPLAVSRPAPGWSEQDPDAWWQATCDCLDALQSSHPKALSAVAAIGLSGQMHGATLLDEQDRVLRPCILWNDGRSAAAVRRARSPGAAAARDHRQRRDAGLHGAQAVVAARARACRLRSRRQGAAAQGLAALEALRRLRRRDVRRLRQPVARRRRAALVAANCSPPAASRRRRCRASSKATRSPANCCRNGCGAGASQRTPLLAGGAGDNAAGAVGVGAVSAGDAFVSLGTSGVLWATTAGFAPCPERGVHAFCHAVPDTWHQMGVLLSAASSLAFWARASGQSEARLLAVLGEQPQRPAPCWFAPYLAGERTPHNDTQVRGGFLGLVGATPPARR